MATKEIKDIDEVIEELQTYTAMEGSEWGEMLDSCMQLLQYQDYFSDRLCKALEAEVRTQHKWAVDNLEIVETTETITRTVKSLEQKQ